MHYRQTNGPNQLKRRILLNIRISTKNNQLSVYNRSGINTTFPTKCPIEYCQLTDGPT